MSVLSSSCCGAPIRIAGLMSYYECTRCGKRCSARCELCEKDHD